MEDDMGSIQRQIEAEERRPDCTGITATYCPVHGDCTCPRPTDTGHEPIEYLNAGGCPLHAPSSDHGEGPNEVERLRAENARLRRLLERAMPYVPCEGASTDPCVRCQISRTVAGVSRHVYPDGATYPLGGYVAPDAGR